MKCPVCREPELKMTERQGIEIDYCPDCRGVWLDRGELDKIVERAAITQPAAAAQAQQPQWNHRDNGYRGDDHRYKDKRHRKRSMFADLFDFD